MRRAAVTVSVIVMAVWMSGCANFSPIPRPSRSARVASADVTAPATPLVD